MDIPNDYVNRQLVRNFKINFLRIIYFKRIVYSQNKKDLLKIAGLYTSKRVIKIIFRGV